MIYIVGSGPTGVAAAKKILEKGHQVTILDAGITLEEEVSFKVNQLKSTNPQNWDKSIISSFKEKLAVDPKGVQKKLIFGSDFPYREVEDHIPLDTKNIGHFTPSFAKGGFSNVWGSAMLPYHKTDLAEWPINVEDLEKYYSSVLNFVPLTGCNDNLQDFFPMYKKEKNTLNSSKQADYILSRLKKGQKILNHKNVYFSKSRLAVNLTKYNKASNCIYCGLCLFGCPKDIIYSTNSTLDELKDDVNFFYVSGIVVTELDEKDGHVEISAYRIDTKERVKFEGEKCYLAAGVISTTKILLKSKSITNTKLTLKASEYFLAPVFQRKAFRKVTEENLHTLSQFFIEVCDKDISEYFIHLQFYTYSELYKLVLDRMLGGVPFFNRLLMPEILGRMMAVQGYLHSNLSSHIELTLEDNKLYLQGIENPYAKQVINKVVKKLNSLTRISDLFIFKPMLKIGLPGEGRHVGGSFPMSKTPQDFQSDLLGRPFGWKNIHVVDSSVFPDVPAPTITFTAMANAQRIVDLSL